MQEFPNRDRQRKQGARGSIRNHLIVGLPVVALFRHRLSGGAADLHRIFGRTHIGKPIEPWSVTMTVSEMKTLLEKVVALVEEIEREARQPRRIA